MKETTYGAFRRVYQSGHTDTWCDGKEHVVTEGGWAENPMDPAVVFAAPSRFGPYLCDCAKWAAINAKYAGGRP